MKKPNAAAFAYVVIGVVFVLVFWMMNAAGHNIHGMKQRLTKLEKSMGQE